MKPTLKKLLLRKWHYIIPVSLMELIFLQRITIRNRKPRIKSLNHDR